MIKDELGYRRRELMFRIIDNRKDHEPITYRLCYLQEHFPPHKLDLALQWLVSNNFVGLRFLMWFDYECRVSDLQMIEKLLRIVDNAPVGPLIAGKNFKI